MRTIYGPTHIDAAVAERQAAQKRRLYGGARVGVLLGLAVTFLVVLVGQGTWPNYLELKLLDKRHRMFPAAQNHPDIAVIVIDDKSLEQLGRWPWPRRYLAHLVKLCRQAGVKELVLDILLPEEQQTEIAWPGVTDLSAYEPRPEFVGEPSWVKIDNDQELAEAIKQAQSTILTFYAKLFRHTQVIPKKFVADDELMRQVDLIFQRNGILNFEQVYSLVYPAGNIRQDDENYHQLLQVYRSCRALQSTRRFGFARNPRQISIPLYHMGLFAPADARFAEAMNNCGFVSVQEDTDGSVRRMPLVGYFEGRIYKQLAFSAACRALSVNDEQIDLSRPDKIILRGPPIEIPLDEQGQMMISWTRDWRDDPGIIPVTVLAEIWDKQRALQENQAKRQMLENLQYQLATVPQDVSKLDEPTRQKVVEMRHNLAQLGDRRALDELIGQLQEEIRQAQDNLRRQLQGRIVLFGSIATGEAGAGARDFVVTPCSELTPGVIVHRHILNTILTKDFIRRPPLYLEVIVILLLGALMTVLSAVFRPLISGLAVLILAGAAGAANFYLAFGYGRYFFAVVTPLAAILASFTLVTFYRQITEGRAKRQITARFKQYTSPAVVDRIVSSPGQVSLAGEIRELSCYFSDLAGFTSISERLGPEKTVRVLNIYLDQMTEVLDRYYATINKFEGDGIFAFFGAPISLPHQGQLACWAALDAQQELHKLVQKQQQASDDFPLLHMRIGISTGKVVVGDCGSQRRFDYTAIGDTVNLGARLESANKIFGSQIMICQKTYQQAAGKISARYLGKVRVVGKEKGVGVYELLGKSEPLPDEQKQSLEIFETAVRYFQEQKFDQAGKFFERFLQYRPADGAALLYLKVLGHFAAQGPPKDFDGCIDLSQK